MSNYLSPLFNEQTFDSNGAPLSGGKIYTYLEGTSTAQVTYTTENGSTPQANPIILNSRGEPDNPIWLAQGIGYKFALHDSNNVLIRTIDRIDGINNPVDTTVDQWQPSGLTPTYISTTSFSYSGDQTSIHHVGRRVKTTNTAGTTYSVITSSSYAAGTTTIVVSNDSGTLDSGLSAVYYAILSASNVSLPRSKAARDALGLGAGADIASATTVDLTARTGNIVRVTGTVTTTAVTMANGDQVWCYAVGAWPLTHHATNLPLPNSENYTCTAGDVLVFTKDNNGTITIKVQSLANLSNSAKHITEGAAGQLLYQSGAGVTGKLAAGAATQVLVGGASAPAWQTARTVRQIVNTTTGAYASGVTAIPLDDTIPQNTEGDQYMSIAITPTSATSTLVINVTAHFANAADPLFTMALFQDTTANALSATTSAYVINTNTTQLNITHVMTSGTTSATTFKVRAGSSTLNTTYFNGYAAARNLGGILNSSITITEYLP